MKSIKYLVLFAYMLNFIDSFGQKIDYFGNDVSFLHSKNITCPNSSDAFLNNYQLLVSYIPGSETSIKTIPLNLNIFQDSTGGNNYPDNQSTIDRLQQIVQWINNIYLYNAFPSDPIPGVPFINDSKVRFVLNRIYFYKNTTLNQSVNLNQCLDYIRNIDSLRMQNLNICFTEGYFPQGSGFAFVPNFDFTADLGIMTFYKRYK